MWGCPRQEHQMAAHALVCSPYAIPSPPYPPVLAPRNRCRILRHACFRCCIRQRGITPAIQLRALWGITLQFNCGARHHHTCPFCGNCSAAFCCMLAFHTSAPPRHSWFQPFLVYFPPPAIRGRDTANCCGILWHTWMLVLRASGSPPHAAVGASGGRPPDWGEVQMAHPAAAPLRHRGTLDNNKRRIMR